MARKVPFTVVLVAIMAIGAIFMSTGNALADTPSTCSTASNGNVTCVQQVLNQEGAATDSTSVSVKAASHGKSKITLLVAEHFVSSAQMKEARKNGECHWYKEVWNSGFVDGSGKLGWKLDHHVYGCWVNGKLYKEGGGITGDACGNLLRLVREPPPKTEVYANAKFVGRMKWVATAHVTATAPANVKVLVSVHNADNSCQSSASATGTATGTATATAMAKATSKAAARASAEGKAVKMSGGLKQEASVKASASAKASATAEASAKATCTPTVPLPPPAVCPDHSATNYGGSLPCMYPPPPTCEELGTCPPPTCEELGTCPPPPPKHWVEVSCTGFEEVSGSAGLTIDCEVNNDNGNPISLYARSNDSNTRVSGINCYSNGGSQTCPSGGTFEFLVSGNNDGSTVLSSSVTVTVSSNGVEKTRVYGPFPVDPKDGGF